MSKCTICGKPIILSPSAKERSVKTGMPESYFKSLFTEHTECALAKRASEVSAAMAAARKRHEEAESRKWRKRVA